jgi:hypothetical protein
MNGDGVWSLGAWVNGRGAWTTGSAGASACARGVRTAAGVARMNDVACGRALAFPG